MGLPELAPPKCGNLGNDLYDYQVLPGVGHDLEKYQRDTGPQLVEFLGRGFREIKTR